VGVKKHIARKTSSQRSAHCSLRHAIRSPSPCNHEHGLPMYQVQTPLYPLPPGEGKGVSRWTLASFNPKTLSAKLVDIADFF